MIVIKQEHELEHVQEQGSPSYEQSSPHNQGNRPRENKNWECLFVGP